MAHWPLAEPVTVLTAPVSPGAGVLPAQDSDPLIRLALTVTGAVPAWFWTLAGLVRRRPVRLARR